jgi:hypothetical protein
MVNIYSLGGESADAPRTAAAHASRDHSTVNVLRQCGLAGYFGSALAPKPGQPKSELKPLKKSYRDVKQALSGKD